MKTFKSFSLTEGLIQVPPKVYKKFENALLTFAFAHMSVEVDEEFIKVVKKVGKKYGVRRFPRPTAKARSSYSNPHEDIPYNDAEVDPSKNIMLYLIYNEREIVHNADFDPEGPAITIYVSNYVREIREAYEEDEVEFMAEQIVTRMQADLKHELMHYVQEVFLQNKDPRQNQQGKMSGQATMTTQDKVEYFTSQQEFDPTIRSEIGEFLAGRSYQPSPKKHIKDSEFFELLKKHKPKKYRIAVNKFVAGIQRFMDSKKTK